jgi:hypothetical protein
LRGCIISIYEKCALNLIIWQSWRTNSLINLFRSCIVKRWYYTIYYCRPVSYFLNKYVIVRHI